jgi:hypothetical protein
MVGPPEVQGVTMSSQPNDVVLPFWESVLTKLRAEDDTYLVTSLSAEERVVHLVFVFESEYWNGGLSQYYYNTDGRDVCRAISALEEIGAAETAELLRRVDSAVFPDVDGVPTIDRRVLPWPFNDELNRRLAEIEATWHELERLPELLERYIEKHVDAEQIATWRRTAQVERDEQERIMELNRAAALAHYEQMKREDPDGVRQAADWSDVDPDPGPKNQ